MARIDPVMPRKSRFVLPPLKYGDDETLGKRIARLRKERGITQTELADKIGIIQSVVSAYERDKLRMYADTAIRFARVLRVTPNVLFGYDDREDNGAEPSLKIARRMRKIEELPPKRQRAVLRTIDAFLD